MRKIPTIFERDWNGNKSLVLNTLAVSLDWLEHAVPTRKYDGTCCLVKDGMLFKRQTMKAGQPVPDGWVWDDPTPDPKSGTVSGFMPIEPGSPSDKWHWEGRNNALENGGLLPDGTYELCGPKVQGNPEKLPRHELIAHASAQSFSIVPLDFDGLKAWLAERDIEGLVWHHPDGRMAKIKKRDFGLKRSPT